MGFKKLKDPLTAKHTLALSRTLKEKLHTLRGRYRIDVNDRIRELIEQEADAELSRLEQSDSK